MVGSLAANLDGYLAFQKVEKMVDPMAEMTGYSLVDQWAD